MSSWHFHSEFQGNGGLEIHESLSNHTHLCHTHRSSNVGDSSDSGTESVRQWNAMTKRVGKLFCKLGLCVLYDRVTHSTAVHQSLVSGFVFFFVLFLCH